MVGFLIRLAVNSLAILIVTHIVRGIEVTSTVTAVVAAFVLGIVNAFLRPIIILLTLPINILTLGLFTFVINALMLELVSWLIPAFHIDTFWTAIGGAIVITIVSFLLNWFLRPDKIQVRVFRG